MTIENYVNDSNPILLKFEIQRNQKKEKKTNTNGLRDVESMLNQQSGVHIDGFAWVHSM